MLRALRWRRDDRWDRVLRERFRDRLQHGDQDFDFGERLESLQNKISVGLQGIYRSPRGFPGSLGVLWSSFRGPSEAPPRSFRDVSKKVPPRSLRGQSKPWVFTRKLSKILAKFSNSKVNHRNFSGIPPGSIWGPSGVSSRSLRNFSRISSRSDWSFLLGKKNSASRCMRRKNSQTLDELRRNPREILEGSWRDPGTPP